jgi:hypothetical protein
VLREAAAVHGEAEQQTGKLAQFQQRLVQGIQGLALLRFPSRLSFALDLPDVVQGRRQFGSDVVSVIGPELLPLQSA